MDSVRIQHMTAERTKKRFGSHEVLYSKYLPRIPEVAEREYVRMTNAYMAILKEELEKELPHLKDAYKQNRDLAVRENIRNDGLTDIIIAVNQVFNTIKNTLVSRLPGFGLRQKLELLANMNRKLTVKEWKRAIKATLGIDILEVYYLGDFYAEQLKKWVDENVSLIVTVPEDTLDKMREIVYKGYMNGTTTTKMVKEIQHAYQIGRRHAELIARDQTSKLNGQIQKAQQEDAGVTEYIWSTSKDERVRKSHLELEGKRCSWSNPPLNSDGRKCHPGQDFQCRCIGRPILDRRTLKLPIT